MFKEAGSIPKVRIRAFNNSPLKTDGQYILYWMSAFSRPFSNFALQRAVEVAKELQKPLLILEILRCNYPYASDRLHRFILNGMADNALYFSSTPAHYYSHVETKSGASQGLLTNLAESACLIVADSYPISPLPQMLQALAEKVAVKMEAVDSNGLLPLWEANRDYPTALAFRRFLQKNLRGHLFDFPQSEPLKKADIPRLGNIPSEISLRWPKASVEVLSASSEVLARLPINHDVAITLARGGWREANLYLERFLAERLPDYLQRSEPERQVTSELSPYLQFGQISIHQIVRRLFEQENWSIDRLALESRGKRSGWWGLSETTESFLDELITWREIGFNTSIFLPKYDQYSSLPEWARETLEKHRSDPRPYLYSVEQFEYAQTHDPLWNAAQVQLLREGKIQNYLRMLWGKKIFEWSPSAEIALKTMLHLNNKYALDGRNPNSVSGIFWCLGRYDRPWGPQRPIYGKIRYMSSENTARKFSIKNYLKQYDAKT